MPTKTRARPIVFPLSRLRGACKEKRKIVRREWPDGIPLTTATAKRVVELGMDLWLIVRTLLTEESENELRLFEHGLWSKYLNGESGWQWDRYRSDFAKLILRLLVKQERKRKLPRVHD